LDAASYATLEQQSENVPPSTYGTVEPGLYDMIVTQKLAPGPGPQTGPAPNVSPRPEATNAR
jgi:cytochrome o ubiquinol oxidase subunit 2